MSKGYRVMVVLLLGAAIAAVLALKVRPGGSGTPPSDAAKVAVAETSRPLPRLVDLGAGKCIPCKKMAPILEELKQDFAGTFEVEFIDMWKNPEAGRPYDIRMNPTRVFIDRTGREVFRHEGFFGRDEILATWKEHGVTVSMAPPE